MEDNTNVNVENQGANNTSTQETNVQNNSIDYSKIEEIVNKNVAKKETAVLKSYFEQQGLEENEISEAIKAYKENKVKNSEDLSNKYNELNGSYSRLQEELNTEKINNKITLGLMKKGLSEEQIPFIERMIDKNVIEDGKINDAKIDENIESVLKAFPNLIQQKEKTSNIRIGSDNNVNLEESSEEFLRKAFGLKK